MVENEVMENDGEDLDFVLMFSGGLDSYLALLTLLDNGVTPTLVYSEHGSRNNEEQLFKALQLARKHKLKLHIDKTLNLGHLEEKSAFIPNRNGLLAFVGANYGDFIYFAIMDGEQTYDDCKRETFIAISMALTRLSGKPVVADSPFWELTKAEVIERLDPSFYPDLLDTYSCHSGTETHCGNCSACFRRYVAFEVNGIKQEDWEINPWETQLAQEYLDKAESGFYGGNRDEEIIRAMGQSF